MRYLTAKELKPYKDTINRLMKTDELKELFSKYNCFYRLVGSSKRNMVLVDENNKFDLDYQIIFRKKIEDTRSGCLIKIKNEFKQKIDIFLTSNGYENGDDSTTAITYKNKSNNQSYDIVLLVQSEDGLKSFHYEDEEKTKMQLCQVEGSKDYVTSIKKIKGKKMWNKLREIYKKNKENNKEQKKSFSLLIESVNETLQKIEE